MGKNLMPKVAKLLGVEIGEVFQTRKPGNKLCNRGKYCIQDSGLVEIDLRRPGSFWDTDGELLNSILQGKCEIVKLPFSPKHGDIYYSMCFKSGTKPSIECYKWEGCIEDFAFQQLEIIYRTKAEAMAHMAEDYERLTGEPLSRES